jgi:hypothetical protein
MLKLEVLFKIAQLNNWYVSCLYHSNKHINYIEEESIICQLKLI